MVKLVEADIETREVLDWQGLHLLHFQLSSCSQKLRIFLNLKGLEWESHPVDLMANENISAWFLGINPRGIVPVLVHDGDVHIESNDILIYLESQFPQPQLIPDQYKNEITALLKHENNLHLDLRALSFRFVFAPETPPKSAAELEQFATTGSGTVGGQKDDWAGVEIEFWQRYAAEGVTDAVVKTAVSKFEAAFGGLDKHLASQLYLLGDALSVLDIAWFIYVDRLTIAGYPIARLHPRVAEWFARLAARAEFAKEIELPPPAKAEFDATRARHEQAGKSLEMVAGL